MHNTVKYNKQTLNDIDRFRLHRIGNLLKQYRLGIMLSRSELASQEKIHKSLIERIETGNNVTLLTLFKFCRIYGIYLNELFQDLD